VRGASSCALSAAVFCIWQSAEEERGDERLLKEDPWRLQSKAAQRRQTREEQAAAAAGADNEQMSDAARGDAGRMLVDAHRPKSFIQLLSDERTNRTVLGWLKEWDPVVFPKYDRDGNRTPSFRGALRSLCFCVCLVHLAACALRLLFAFALCAAGNTPLRGRVTITKALGLCHRHRTRLPASHFAVPLLLPPDTTFPEHKILVLYGPPGTGKTTLAHVLSKQAGYNATEINASDERSTVGLKNRLDALVSMQGSFNDGRPNCIIMDEIDGCLGAEGTGAVDLLMKYCRDSVAAEKALHAFKKSVASGFEENDDEEGEDPATAALRQDGSVKFLGDRKKAGKGKGGGLSKQKGRAPKAPKILQRPIICICNDLYAPALRNLRQLREAKLIKMTAPDTHRMVTRLQLICEREKLQAQRQALTMLHEMHTGDIRSCLNALQMLSMQPGAIDVARIRTQGGTVRDSQSAGYFQVMPAVFRAAGSQGSSKGNKVAEDKDDAIRDLRKELKNHFSDMGFILQGCHHNYPNIKYTDPRMLKTAACLEELTVSDLISQRINSQQHWALSPYLVIA